MTNRENITRTCVICGLPKPISAFLQISGAQGTSYGTICFSCRSAGLTEKKDHTLEDEFSTASSGQTIGAKQKLQIDKKRVQDRKDMKQQHVEENKKKDQVTSDKSERKDTKQRAERVHRETYIEAKKSLLNYKTPTSSQSLASQKKDAPTSANADNTATTDESVKFLETGHSSENKISSNEVVSGAQVFNRRLQAMTRDSPLFRAYLLSVLGADAPIAKATNQFYQSKKVDAGDKQSMTNKSAPEKPDNKEALDYIEKNWSPSSRKR